MHFSFTFFSASALAAVTAVSALSIKTNKDSTVPDSKYDGIFILPGVDVDFQRFNWNRLEDGTIRSDHSFMLYLQEPALIQVVDYGFNGDTYEIYDMENRIESTTVNTNSDNNITFAETPEDAWGDKRFWQLEYPVSKGHHQVDVRVVHSDDDSGSGAVRLVTNEIYRPEKPLYERI
ncbi:hypothetical protein BC940DRAFT_345768 [Gongronella butleri]|nr:hypothetical protein BC940DRAFT_345768 [Gongronella butleri]